MSAKYTRLGQLDGKFGVHAREYLAAHDFGGNLTYKIYMLPSRNPKRNLASIR